MAAIKPKRVFKVVKPLFLRFVATVGQPAPSLQKHRGTEKAIAVLERAHVSGVSLGAATGLWLASKYPQRVKSLSLHSCWPKTDPFLKVVVEGWRSIAKALDSVQEMIVQGIFPYCFTPELYAAKPEYIDRLAARGFRAQQAEAAA